jgi:DNA processing protein
MEATELRAWLRLTSTPGVGGGTARRLLAAYASPEAVFTRNFAALLQHCTEAQARALLTEAPGLPAQLALTLDWLSAADDRYIATPGEPAYPAGLLQIEDPPLLLYLEGSLAGKPIAVETALAMVGSRNPTPQGELNARQFARALASEGLTIVSGMALGIDGAAHDGALLGGGETIAVVGTGVDIVYPKRHIELRRRITCQGMVVSEFPLGTPPINSNFPRRNRIISALAAGTLVVEAAQPSGSLITARLALEQGREVFAIPGSIHSPLSRGCHALIRQGAKLVETAQDVLEELRLPPRPVSMAGAPRADGALLTALGFDPASLDALQARTGWPTSLLQAQLLELELGGEVARLPGGLFQRLASS